MYPALHVTQAVALKSLIAPEPAGHAAQAAAPACAEYVPAAQKTHKVFPEPDVAGAEPAGQGAHPVAPDKGATVPGGHARHVLALLAPTIVLNVPAMHATQEFPDRYVPARHFMHGAGTLALILYVKVPAAEQALCGGRGAGALKPGSCTGVTSSLPLSGCKDIRPTPLAKSIANAPAE